VNPSQEPQEPVEPQIPAVSQVSQGEPQESKVEPVSGENKDQASEHFLCRWSSYYKMY
jgi:hypothetical protein